MIYRAVLENLTEMQTLAEMIAELSQTGDVITLKGDLGVGKSEFARAFIRFFIGDGTDVPSPTFSLAQTYHSQDFSIWHFDLYRLKQDEEIYELGLEEALSDAISLIEWPERMTSIHLSQHLEIQISDKNNDQQRSIALIPDAYWQQKLLSFQNL